MRKYHAEIDKKAIAGADYCTWFCVGDFDWLHFIDPSVQCARWCYGQIYCMLLYTSTSAVCVTGLIAIDAGDTFTAVGQFFLAALIQVGGLGVTAVGAGIILAMGKRVNLKERNLIREAMNLNSGKGLVNFVKSIFLTTVIFELTGALLSFTVFVRDYPPLELTGYQSVSFGGSI